MPSFPFLPSVLFFPFSFFIFTFILVLNEIYDMGMVNWHNFTWWYRCKKAFVSHKCENPLQGQFIHAHISNVLKCMRNISIVVAMKHGGSTTKKFMYDCMGKYDYKLHYKSSHLLSIYVSWSFKCFASRSFPFFNFHFSLSLMIGSLSLSLSFILSFLFILSFSLLQFTFY